MAPANPTDLAAAVRDKAVSLVEAHAERLGMDAMAASVLVRAIRTIPLELPALDGTARRAA